MPVSPEAAGAVRLTYRPLGGDEAHAVEAMKLDYARIWDGLNNALSHVSEPRQIALAKTKLEESCMWAVKALTG